MLNSELFILVKLLLGNFLKHLEVKVQKEKQNCFALLQLAGGDCKSEYLVT